LKRSEWIAILGLTVTLFGSGIGAFLNLSERSAVHSVQITEMKEQLAAIQARHEKMMEKLVDRLDSRSARYLTSMPGPADDESMADEADVPGNETTTAEPK
jgi:hypothetical protein